ncbi:DUF5347 domain-containing protein [Pantoea agglomerans]|uniref:DUF5347 domain-containing protein n=1 Tax=Enterobacter agglomerans TaxID=549 RepID=UPI003C7CA6F2
MAIETESNAVQLNAGQRVSGLNHIAAIRAQLWGDNCGNELKRFLADMNDKRDAQYEQNKRALAAIFFLANISKERHDVQFNELTGAEKIALIVAMNHFRAVVSLFPKRLTLPN